MLPSFLFYCGWQKRIKLSETAVFLSFSAERENGLNKIRLSNLSGLVRTVSQVVGGAFCDFKFLVVDKGIIDKVVTLRVNFPCAL